MTEMPARVLEDAPIPVKLKLSASWVVLLLLYAYGDIIAFFRPGYVEDVMAGEVADFEIGQAFLLGISIYVAIPAVMVIACLVLKPRVNRWLNVVLGLVYAVTIVVAAIGDDYVYYYFLSVVEVAIALLIASLARTWPTEPTRS